MTHKRGDSFGKEDQGTFEISKRERALFLIHEYDLEAQLLAIRGILQRNKQHDEALAAQIKALEDEPWVFYMSAQFIQHCLTTIDQVLEGVGTYLKQHGEVGLDAKLRQSDD